MANSAGQDLLCRICGLEVKVTKGGEGIVRCCGQPMAVITEQK
jgi:desulfoferrodoxin-like iron-binding protein